MPILKARFRSRNLAFLSGYLGTLREKSVRSTGFAHSQLESPEVAIDSSLIDETGDLDWQGWEAKTPFESLNPHQRGRSGRKLARR